MTTVASDPPAPSEPGFDRITQAIHWLSLVAVAAAFAVGLAMEDVPRGPEKAQIQNLHASLGVLVMALTVARLGWRAAVPALEPLPGSQLMQFAAGAMKLALYAVLLAIPLTGVLMMAAKGRSFEVFGLVAVPPLLAPDRALGSQLEELHEAVANLMLVLVGLHTVAALHHHYVLGDRGLVRMLPWRPRA